MEILEVFLTSLIRVGLLVAMAVPGFVLKKLKKLPENSIAVISALIIYISQPMLSLYSFIDSDGNFTMPFKLYSIGYKIFGDYRLRSDLE